MLSTLIDVYTKKLVAWMFIKWWQQHLHVSRSKQACSWQKQQCCTFVNLSRCQREMLSSHRYAREMRVRKRSAERDNECDVPTRIHMKDTKAQRQYEELHLQFNMILEERKNHSVCLRDNSHEIKWKANGEEFSCFLDVFPEKRPL